MHVKDHDKNIFLVIYIFVELGSLLYKVSALWDPAEEILRDRLLHHESLPPLEQRVSRAEHHRGQAR